jgi:hypothetical protein
VGQISIAIGALGMVLALMGLFPGLTGIRTGAGVGIVQFTAMQVGFTLLHLGALSYVRFMLYPNQPSTLLQQIGTRLTFTGLLLSLFIGAADYFGYGSHAVAVQTTYFGGLQALGVCLGWLLASLGVFIYAVAGLRAGVSTPLVTSP